MVKDRSAAPRTSLPLIPTRSTQLAMEVRSGFGGAGSVFRVLVGPAMWLILGGLIRLFCSPQPANPGVGAQGGGAGEEEEAAAGD